MKLKYEVECVDMGDEIIIVPIGNGADQINGVFKTNKEGMKILNMLKNDTSVEGIVTQLTQEYTTNLELIKKYVNEFVRQLKAMDFLKE